MIDEVLKDSGVELVHDLLAVALGENEPGVAKRAQVARDGRPRRWKLVSDLAGGFGPVPEEAKDLAPGGVGQRTEGIHTFGNITSLANYASMIVDFRFGVRELANGFVERSSQIALMNSDRSYTTDDSCRPVLLEEDVTREIIGAFYEVYNALGYGFLERIYSRALEIAIKRRGLTVELEFPIEVFFQGQQIGVHRLDMLVQGRVVVENKSTRKLVDADTRQLRSSVTAANLAVGLLLHFGPRPSFHRVLGGWRPMQKESDPNISE